jgi:hypothetical protein
VVATAVDVAPFILQKPTISIGPAGAEVEIQCGANQVDAHPEQDSNDVETFCGVYTSYKPEKWTITVTCVQSFGAAGLWNLLRPLCNTVQPFLLVPDSRVAVSVDNVAMAGDAYVTGFAYLSGAVGEASEFDLVLAVQGEPTFPIVPPVMTMAADAEGADAA